TQRIPGAAARQHRGKGDRGSERPPGRLRRKAWRRRSEPDGAPDTLPQAGRRRLGRQPLAQRLPQRLDAGALLRQRRVGRNALLERDRVGRIELAVDRGVHEQQVALLWTGAHRLAPIAWIRRWRARASRDMTVPTGTPVTPAISR